MIKIAAVSDDGVTISAHFGRAPIYVVVSVDGGRILSRETRDKLGHAQFAAIADCQVLLARGMGAGAFASMQQAGIEPIVTDIEDIGAAVGAHFDGTLPNLVEKLH